MCLKQQTSQVVKHEGTVRFPPELVRSEATNPVQLEKSVCEACLRLEEDVSCQFIIAQCPLMRTSWTLRDDQSDKGLN